MSKSIGKRILQAQFLKDFFFCLISTYWVWKSLICGGIQI